MVFAAMFSAYLFVGRNFTRLANIQQQEVQGRRTLQRFTQDLSAATKLTTVLPTEVALTKQLASGTATVSYTYSAADGTFTRTDNTGTQTLLSGVTGVTLSYFSEAGNATSTPHSVKSVELLVSSAVGNASGGTRATHTTASSRIVLRNKAALQ